MSADFPFIGVEVAATEEELPLFTQPAWNFEVDKFIFDGNGQHVIVTGQEALKVWIYKALKTERFSYLAYSWQYGIELHPFVGKVMSVQERYSELRRVITECLMVNPYILSVDSIEFSPENKGNVVNTDIVLSTVYGEVRISV